MIRRAGLVVVPVAGMALASEATVALADTATNRQEAALKKRKKKPVIPARDVKALAQLLDLPRGTVKRGLAKPDNGDAEQMQSGPTALPPDDALLIRHYAQFAGAPGEQIFLIRLVAAPDDPAVHYEYGLAVAIDGQPQSTPNPSAIAGFGRVALSRMWVNPPGGEFLALNPAAGFSRVMSGASGTDSGVYVLFRVPDDELGTGSYYLQAFGRQGDTAESPAGYSIVMSTLET